MEFMKIDGFLGRQISKLINKGIAAKVGFSPEIEVRKFSFESIDPENTVRVQFEAVMSQKDFEKLIEGVTK